MVPENTGQTFTMDTIADFSAKRFDEAIGENPYFFYGPYTGLIARNAGMLFIFRLMADHSVGGVEGVLSEFDLGFRNSERWLNKSKRTTSLKASSR